jgi:hypothetical protein
VLLASPNAGVLVAAPNAGVLLAPNAGVLLGTPNAGVLLGVPKAGVEPKEKPLALDAGAPKAGVLLAPKAGVLLAPKAGVLLAPKEKAMVTDRVIYVSLHVISGSVLNAPCFKSNRPSYATGRDPIGCSHDI